jgi:hypothetical protein
VNAPGLGENVGVLATVWIEDWQQQCCGQPFAVGSRVSWTLIVPDAERLASVLGPDLSASITHAEEHHGGRPEHAAATMGTVRSIRAVRCRYAHLPGADSRMHRPVPGSTAMTSVNAADGWETEQENLRFVGYLVELETEADAASAV